jgi:hypothetical protein
MDWAGFTKNTEASCMCDPLRDPIRFPFVLYVILVIIGFFLTLRAIINAPHKDHLGNRISPQRKWALGLLVLIIFLLVAFFFGSWIYALSSQCDGTSAWLIFFLAILFPVILFAVTIVIIAVLIGLNVSVWLWAFGLSDCNEKLDCDSDCD